MTSQAQCSTDAQEQVNKTKLKAILDEHTGIMLWEVESTIKPVVLASEELQVMPNTQVADYINASNWRSYMPYFPKSELNFQSEEQHGNIEYSIALRYRTMFRISEIITPIICVLRQTVFRLYQHSLEEIVDYIMHAIPESTYQALDKQAADIANSNLTIFLLNNTMFNQVVHDHLISKLDDITLNRLAYSMSTCLRIILAEKNRRMNNGQGD